MYFPKGFDAKAQSREDAPRRCSKNWIADQNIQSSTSVRVSVSSRLCVEPLHNCRQSPAGFVVSFIPESKIENLLRPVS